MFNKIKGFVSTLFAGAVSFVSKPAVRVCAAILVPAALCVTAKATGVADVDISQGADNVQASWNYIKTILIAIGVFLVAWGFFKKLRRA